MKFSLVGSDKPIIIVQTKVNGKGPFNFAVDTGASVTALSKQLAQKLKISETGNIHKKGHGCCGEIDAAIPSVKSVVDINVRDIQVALMDLRYSTKC